MSQRSTYSGGNDPYSALLGAGVGGGGGAGGGGGSAGGGDDNQSVKSNEKMYGHKSHMGNKFFKIKLVEKYMLFKITMIWSVIFVYKSI